MQTLQNEDPVYISDESLKQMYHFKYLGSTQPSSQVRS